MRIEPLLPTPTAGQQPETPAQAYRATTPRVRPVQEDDVRLAGAQPGADIGDEVLLTLIEGVLAHLARHPVTLLQPYITAAHPYGDDVPAWIAPARHALQHAGRAVLGLSVEGCILDEAGALPFVLDLQLLNLYRIPDRAERTGRFTPAWSDERWRGARVEFTLRAVLIPGAPPPGDAGSPLFAQASVGAPARPRQIAARLDPATVPPAPHARTALHADEQFATGDVLADAAHCLDTRA